ncbi:MAG: 16S rRNA (cytosine(1402)-N(4))-methyltransferase RsmH [Patescibacteria group bacterium]|nr:16S rRNA (cytosine(1402)-N(4))-methyltransferase RsmH [bacterium]MDZ4240657.1 16S rRNA (cytosine(1402)-N(4))-methyltransferase RsmH [Patescibacteria group bacterium]
MSHVSVLLQEVVAGLLPKEGSVFLDATVGNGGHGASVAALLGSKGTYVGIDRDADRLEEAKKSLGTAKCRVILKQANFRNLDTVLDEAGIKEAHSILFDLGLNSEQLEVSGRGFSFQKDEPLLMTFEKEITPETTTAFSIINGWSKEDLEWLLYEYGEESFGRRIASAIVEQRNKKPIGTTAELVDVIKKATPSWYATRRIHPATKTFQALRMAVNDEVGALKEGLTKGFARLADKGRMGVISFHSGEDRTVKTFFREREKEETASLVNKKVITADFKEVKDNPRARSAKLRIIEKTI